MPDGMSGAIAGVSDDLASASASKSAVDRGNSSRTKADVAFMRAVLPKSAHAYCLAGYALCDIDNTNGGPERLLPLGVALMNAALEQPAEDLQDAFALLSIAAHITDTLTDADPRDEEMIHDEIINLRRALRAALPIVARQARVQLGATPAAAFLDYCSVLVRNGEMPA